MIHDGFLVQIVICPELQTPHLIVRRIPCRNDQDPFGLAKPPELAKNVEAITIRQGNVQQNTGVVGFMDIL